MNAAAANPIDPLAVAPGEQVSFKRFLVYSLTLHGLLVLSLALSIYIKFQGEQWGGSTGGQEGSVNIKTVGPTPGIPLPPKPAVDESKTADPSNDLFAEKNPPKPIPVPDREPTRPADKIAPFKKEKPLPETHRSKTDQPKEPPPDNAIPGHGAPPKMPTATYSTQPPGGGNSVSVVGQGGDFASKYGWYIDSVVRRINQTWDQPSIDPAVRAAHTAKTVMTFKIYRDGSIHNITMAQSSGNLSMDNSARRALAGIQFGPLPTDFSGASVDVTFDFDLSLTH